MSDTTGWVAVAAGEAPWEPVERARRARMAVLAGSHRGPVGWVTGRFGLVLGGAIPARRRDAVQHQQLVLRGEMVLALDGVERVVRAGDGVFIPAGTVHAQEHRFLDQEVGSRVWFRPSPSTPPTGWAKQRRGQEWTRTRCSPAKVAPITHHSRRR